MERQSPRPTREQLAEAMTKLPAGLHRMLVWLCTGVDPEQRAAA